MRLINGVQKILTYSPTECYTKYSSINVRIRNEVALWEKGEIFKQLKKN